MSATPPRSSAGAPERGGGTFTAFVGVQRIASGALPDVAIVVVRALAASEGADQRPSVLVFDDGSGRVVDLDLRGTEAEVRTRAEARASVLAEAPPASASSGSGRPPPPGKRRRGRPRLGVVGKEVTLLPRHWAWLDAQPGGASATLRRLVAAARRTGENQSRVREARDVAYRFMAAVGGDLPGYEEALRALFRGDAETFHGEIEGWPPDVRDHARRLAAEGLDSAGAGSGALGEDR